jgi:hypothetical protein
MAVHQLVMTGVPAFVSVVQGPTRVRFHVDPNDFNPANVIDVDLAKNPAVIPPAQWATDVDVDYQTTGGFTTIGPRFHGGSHVGAAYLSERLVTQFKPVLATWPPAPDELYQYQAVLRSDNGVITRYHGFKVRVMSPGTGTLAHLGFIRVGTSAPSLGADWIDLADPAISDPAANGFTTITTSSARGTEGALFLTSGAMAAMAKPGPKIPVFAGW